MEIESSRPNVLEFVRNKKAEHKNSLQIESTQSAPHQFNTELSEKFILPHNKDFENQYSHVYYMRLAILKKPLKQILQDKGKKIVDNILKLSNENGYVIGTVYKEMKLKPSILARLNAPFQKLASDILSNLTSDDDEVYLEDEYGRIKLVLEDAMFTDLTGKVTKITAKDLATGLIAALSGTVRNGNRFHVQEVVFCGLAQQYVLKHGDDPLPFTLPYNVSTTRTKEGNNFRSLDEVLQSPALIASSEYVLIISGLHITSENTSLAALNTLKHFLLGTNNDDSVSQSPTSLLAQKIIRVIIAGNIMSEVSDLEQIIMGPLKIQQDQYTKIHETIKRSMEFLDKWMLPISYSKQIDVMPGVNDPSNNLMPQQPFQHCFLPECFKNQRVSARTNPYGFTQNRVAFLGTSGQNLTDLKRYCKVYENNLDLMQMQLLWSHIAPTAPDTLSSYPFNDRDCFVLEDLPHVYFVGNCETFETRLVYEKETEKFCRLVCVPTFYNTGAAALVNLTTLDTYELQIA